MPSSPLSSEIGTLVDLQRDSPASPVTIARRPYKPAMPEFPAPDLGVARLCASCQRATFRDGKRRVVADGDDENGAHLDMLGRMKLIIDTEYMHFHARLPDISGLDASARKGCDLCRFLRAIILSGDTDDCLSRNSGKYLAGLGSREVSISIVYDWAIMGPWSDIPSIRIRLSIEGIADVIELLCLLEGIPGTGRNSNFLLAALQVHPIL